MSALQEFTNYLLKEYFRDSDEAEKYYSSWIDRGLHALSYEQLGSLMSDLLPLIEEESFDIPSKVDGHNAFEHFVASIVEQLFRTRGIIVDPLDESKYPFIHIGKLKSLTAKTVHQNLL